MAETERLTAREVVALAKKPGLYADGGGLYLQVTDTGASWVYRFMLNGRARTMGLGPLALYSLAEARAKAQDARRLRHEGIDPIEARRASKAATAIAGAAAMTFNQCREAYIKAHRAEWRSAVHSQQWEASLDAYAGPIDGLPVQAIDTALVLKVLEPIWATRRETASRVRGRIESVIDWTKARGYRTGENPARWRGHLENLLARKSKIKVHLAAMPYSEVPGFMLALREQEGVGVCPLEFTILTAARTDQTVGAKWREVDLAAKTWTIPAARMKAGVEHRVPLSARAVAILGTAGDAHDFVFPGVKPGKPVANSAMLKTLKAHSDATVHGFRSSFRTWAGERTSFQREVIEVAMAHTVGDETERAYDRGEYFEKRRRLMDEWARYCATPKAISGKVIPINKKSTTK
jgi:integrase